MDDDNCPLPYVDFNKFCDYQTDLLLKETDSFFKQHNLRLRKYVLPVKLPEWAKTFSEVLDRGKEYEPLTTIYRHKHFLKCRILHNYSYIETKWNRSNDIRNKNIPFDLRPLTSEILNQLDIINEDMLDPEFSGLLVTLNTNTFGEMNSNQESDNNSGSNNNQNNGNQSNKEEDLKILMNGVLSSEFSGRNGLNNEIFQVKEEESERLVNGLVHKEQIGDRKDKEDRDDRSTKEKDGNGDNRKKGEKGKKEKKEDKAEEKKEEKEGEEEEDKEGEENDNDEEEKPMNGKISKIIAGALVECLVTNERCIKSIWVHPDLSKHSSRIVLQSFLPRLMYEIFLLPSVVTDKGISTYNKFTYIMHNDLDLFPRQCWLLLASNKKMSLPRHYEPSTFEEHPVQLEYGDCHTDEVGYLFSKSRHRNMPYNLTSLNRLPAFKYSEFGTNLRNMRETRRNSLRSEKNVNQSNRNSSSRDDRNSREKDRDSRSKEDKDKEDRDDRSTKEEDEDNEDSDGKRTRRGRRNSGGNGSNKNKRNGSKDRDNSKDKEENDEDEENKDRKDRSNNVEKDEKKEDKERLTKLIGSNTGLKQLKELFLQVGSVTSTRDVCCTCRREKLTKSVDDQAWLDRLVGCTENYMYLMLPKRCERSRLGLLVRDGWRDLLTPHFDPVLMNDLNNLLPEYARFDGFFFKNNTLNYNADVEEWCRLRREDLIDVTSDTEVYMRLPDNCN